MNHDNLRLNSTHNPENSHISHIFLMKVSKAKLEFRKIVHLAEQSEAMVLPLKYDEISVITTFRFEQNLKPLKNSRSVKTDAS